MECGGEVINVRLVILGMWKQILGWKDGVDLVYLVV